MNISKEVQTRAGELGLDAVSTGGGSDYIWRKLNNGIEVVLSANIMDGSPETLAEPTHLAIYFSDAWRDGVVVGFETCELALQAMSAMGVIGNIEWSASNVLDDNLEPEPEARDA